MKCPQNRCSYLHERLRLDRKRIILSDRDTASKLHKWPPRPICELPLPQLPFEAGRVSMDFCVASLSRVDPYAVSAHWPAVVEQSKIGEPTSWT